MLHLKNLTWWIFSGDRFKFIFLKYVKKTVFTSCIKNLKFVNWWNLLIYETYLLLRNAIYLLEEKKILVEDVSWI